MKTKQTPSVKKPSAAQATIPTGALCQTQCADRSVIGRVDAFQEPMRLLEDDAL